MKRLLIANRGEIALRVLRTAREMGVETIAVYSEADRDMEYLDYADETVQIGPAHSSRSYLDVDAIMSAAITWKANAIHPGYGFLSENAILADACEKNGIAFIGPKSSTLRTIGNKSRTKQVAMSLGIPTIQGSQGIISDIDHAISAVRQIGFPVILKSVYGGGGRGMKVAYNEDQLRTHFASASSEARAAFGRSEVYVESYISCPRHLEVQVVADSYGNVRVLGDRECSIQRKHQKLIEESPISNVDEGIREMIWGWAERIMSSIQYLGMGTVEFLMDQEGRLFFLEVNGRLQVEHPVTEMVTGVDMVKEQIMVAAGARVDRTPPSINGHALECRLNAEDPLKNFMPTAGTIRKLRLPGGPGTRVDTHLYPGCVISSFYDPMLAKLIAYHSTRPEVICRMCRMLDETQVLGVTTNKELLKQLMNNKQFIEGNGDTSLVRRLLKKQKSLL